MSPVLRDTPRVTRILRKCYSHGEVADRDRNRGIGVTNLKQAGWPDAVATAGIDAITALATTSRL